MLTRNRRPVCLSLLALDLPVATSLETSATVLQHDADRLHILLSEPAIGDFDSLGLMSPPSRSPNPDAPDRSAQALPPRDKTANPLADGLADREKADRQETEHQAAQRHLWLEISATRTILTVQSATGLNYRHLWERGVYGLSRYWLAAPPVAEQSPGRIGEIRLRNFTRSLTLAGQPRPEHLRLEYELWAQQLPMGRYVLNLEIFH